MNISLFDVLGPVMIGPSSSHTAGAAKLARIARIIAQRPFHRVRFGAARILCQNWAGARHSSGTARRCNGPF